MPRRLIRDGILTSDRIDQLDVHSERFYFRLLLIADDFGRFSADSRILRSSVFPLKDNVRTADISRLLAACEKAGLIRLYTVGEKEYLEIQDFRQTIRAKASKYPPPNDKCGADESHMHSTCGAHVPEDEDEDEDDIYKNKIEGEYNNLACDARRTEESPTPTISKYPSTIDEIFEIASRPTCGMQITREQADIYLTNRMASDWVDAARRRIPVGRVPADLKRWLMRDKDAASRREESDAQYRDVGF